MRVEKFIWMQDLKVCGLSEAGTQDRLSWRSSVKNSRQEPTPSNGSLLQSMAAPPAQRVLGMRTRSFNKTGFDWLIDWLDTRGVCREWYFGLLDWTQKAKAGSSMPQEHTPHPTPPHPTPTPQFSNQNVDNCDLQRGWIPGPCFNIRYDVLS